ncbi:MAG: glycoside hydrolase family 127 protein [Bacteroidales bacterium]
MYHFKTPLDRQVVINVNGIEIDFKIRDGYAVLNREWVENDKIEVYLPMPVQEVIANKNVIEDESRFALQCGPLIYCIEEIDHGIWIV